MKTETISMSRLFASEGMWLTQKERPEEVSHITLAKEVVCRSDKADIWKEIPETEAAEIRALQAEAEAAAQAEEAEEAEQAQTETPCS